MRSNPSYIVIFDLDDFAQDSDSNAFDLLIELKSKYPHFKVTLFTILGRWIDRGLLKGISQFPWVQLAAHGYYHFTNSEVMEWDKAKWYEVLSAYENEGYFQKGFKAPNWEMSTLGYQVLKDMGWWVACRSQQISEVPEGLQYYAFEQNMHGEHGHTWTLRPDLADGRFNWITNARFSFVSESLEEKI